MLRFIWKWFFRLAVAAVVILVAVLAYTSIISRPMPEHTFTDTDQLLAIAHRGGAGLWPENTLFAFQNAVRIGADALEFDVHATSDGELVVIHDATVDRTTDGAGRVDEMTWDALRELDAGYRWTADDGASFPFRGMGLRVPTLEEALNALPDTRMIIELKDVSDAARVRFSEAIAQCSYPERKVIASFQSESVKYIRDNNPGIATSSTAGEVLGFWVLNSLRLGFAFVPGGETMQVPPSFQDRTLVSNRFVSGAHRHNMDVYVWTINEEAEMKRHVDHGVDGIITDYPDRLLQVLDRYPELREPDYGEGEAPTL
ncbi:MAG: glycerophosphodiester phosphodiesterase [Gemmatimonadetes bacterium]|nr:glycerophosphodiester phosphodiesterase [Gemmatimonadota bacterium]MYG85042.1 glycerophosphodiester phosphodiesterase [Gemmatimonadota bacterium]MYJ89169.1 glycerophosphodiester phosphodiesterase [Gemmatimonadota bacterium]